MGLLSQVEYGRLLKLADALENVDPYAFNMDGWIVRRAAPAVYARTGFFGFGRKIELAPACGFAGCAMGWAVHLNVFAGFSFGDEGGLKYDAGDTVYNNWEAVDKFFGFSGARGKFEMSAHEGGRASRISIYFFYGLSYWNSNPTPSDVVKRIRRFVQLAQSLEARRLEKLVTKFPSVVVPLEKYNKAA